MVNNLLYIKNWNAEVNRKFLSELEHLDNDACCRIIADTARQLMKRRDHGNIASAESILIYATQRYFDSVNKNIKAEIYYLLGQLYENHLENFVKAYTYYNKYTLNNTVNEGNHAILLRALILRDDFSYSDELEKELRFTLGEYDLGLRNDRLYENIGRLIVAQKENDKENIQLFTKRLKANIKADELFFLDIIFKKDAVPDTLRVPQKVIDYINGL